MSKVQMKPVVSKLVGAAVLAAAMCARFAGPSVAADRPTGQFDAQLFEKIVGKAIEHLKKSQAADGSFSGQAGPAVTAIAVNALLRHGRSPEEPVVAKGLAYLQKFSRDDGGIYAEGSNYKNYETCLAIACFAEANRDGRYKTLLAKAEAFVKNVQWDEGEGIDRTNNAYGGAGYGTKKRPDLSNTSFLMDALKAAGTDADDPALQNALIFVSRCQNLETEFNTTEFAAKNPDGGFYYTPAGGGESQAGKTDEGGLRSYASMTYAGLKSMIYAGVGPDDPRVKAALAWLKKNYDVASNPGMGTAGLYYYYNTFAKALDAMGESTFEDADGVKHDWRAELIAELARKQRPDGSWLNENSRWMEGDANLVTAYALLALSHCNPNKPGSQ